MCGSGGGGGGGAMPIALRHLLPLRSATLYAGLVFVSGLCVHEDVHTWYYGGP